MLNILFTTALGAQMPDIFFDPLLESRMYVPFYTKT